MAQKYRVETNSIIKPYVVRDHAWSNVQHDEMNAREYQEDAPDGYAESQDFEPEPYNKPLDKSSKKPKSVVQHSEHKEAANDLKKEIKKDEKKK